MSISSGPSSLTLEPPSGANPLWKLAEKNGFSEEEAGEEEEEEEIDQLASEEDQEEEDITQEAASGSAPRHYRRAPGTTLLPGVKIENILQADGVMGNLSVSKEGLHVLSIATEEFIKRLTQGGHRQANSARRSAINYRDMADTTRQYQEFMFLQDIIPYPVPLSEALELREAALKDSSFNDAAPMPFPRSASAPNPTKASSFKPKPKHSAVNGKEKINGSTSGRKELNTSVSMVNGNNRGGQVLSWEGPSSGSNVLDARPWTHWTEPITHETVHQNPLQAEHEIGNPHGVNSTSTNSSSISPQPSASAVPLVETPFQSAFTGPASGFLQGPAHVPGRTIYAQESPD
ncbi:hypothetical protein F5879DRAFT_229349 [Lentinula edodes]|uniref:uncharacterized protein n=1 Tax=Lentinula edodes TaxID=5353 RepID=UPI001E8D6768|nr:uncharacterized protein C8R40DRAFT_1235545 [Lentinula edodes]KAH7877957.1 hypothetical protein C8R40DRAFT_1235545 [Lentinula edodes]KAJ3910564.1 hypothetical protein F5879DRAFT_229349 [Lentinula edodes]